MFVCVEHEEERGCGFRKPAKDGVGIYLIGDGIFEACERLPFPLTICPCCGAGIKFSRGFTWIDPTKLFAIDLDPRCDRAAGHAHARCGMCRPEGIGTRAGLMWVGESHYKTPHLFVREAMGRGVSKKIAAVPNDFRLGEHFIYLAHRKAITDYEDREQPMKTGVFMYFRPVRVDLVIDDEKNIPEKAQQLVERLGDKARLVKVVREKQKTLL